MYNVRAHFEAELSRLQERMLEMATCTDSMVGMALESLITGDIEKTQSVIHQDKSVDQLDLDIESDCLRLIATQQPVARDLRVIGAALKVITDIERIGDYAVDIAKVGRRLARANVVYRPVVDLPRLASMSRTMLHQALQAFIHHDMILVEKVITSDDEVDRLYHTMRDALTQSIIEDASRGLLALNVLFAAKYLERISDHVVNIVERVWFIEKGELLPSKQILLQDEDA